MNNLLQYFYRSLRFLWSSFNDLVDSFSSTWSRIAGALERSSSYPPVRFVAWVSSNAVSFAENLLSKYSLVQDGNPSSKISSFMDQLNAWTSLLSRVTSALASGEPLVSYEYEHDFHEGTLKYKQVLPLDWESLIEGPKIRHLVEKYRGQEQQQQPSFDHDRFQSDVMEAVRAVEAVLNLGHVMPPFSAHAIVTAGSTVRTFDGKMVNFAGECSYLLTSDFLHNRFSLVGHYRDGRRQGITLTTEGFKINIDKEDKVSNYICIVNFF